MNKVYIAIAALSGTLSACGPLPDNYAGNVVAYNGKTVTIDAIYSPTNRPTPAMQAMADQTCKSQSTFLSISNPHGGVKQVITPTGFAYVADGSPIQTFHYLFAC